jgi:hypothetical protein
MGSPNINQNYYSISHLLRLWSPLSQYPVLKIIVLPEGVVRATPDFKQRISASVKLNGRVEGSYASDMMRNGSILPVGVSTYISRNRFSTSYTAHVLMLRAQKPINSFRQYQTPTLRRQHLLLASLFTQYSWLL